MKRRNFLKTGAVAAGLVTIPNTLLQLTACKSQNLSSGSMVAEGEEIRTSEYLNRVRADKYLPGPPVFAKSKLTPAVQISPMQLEDRIRRKIVPQRGFCCLAPGGDALSSGNGVVNIEVAGNPYTEQIPFSHESLFTSRKKFSEAPKIANVFPQVRQMILDGKYHYWFIITTGKYRSVSALTNVNTNLQIAPISLGNYPEGEMAYFDWVESLVPDYRTNAKNIYGMRGTHYPIAPTKDSGVFNMFDYADNTGETWPHPYWISAGGWVVRPFWDHYLVTGDLDFLLKRMVPIYKDLALFYEDFLTVTDKNGNYIFVPSFSPENNPGNLNPGCMAVINASMDISVCREVLANLVEACELLGIEADSVPKWKAMLSRLPPYLLEPDGTLKEWAWPDLEERYNHRHVSQCYGVWPGDEIDPDRTPQLAKAAVIADRKRVHERLAAHSQCQRALIGARLKDNYMVDSELRQLLEQGFVSTTLLCPHDPYANMRIADAQGGIPAIMMEMLAYSRPGVIEVLPALPPSLVKGSINGMLLRTFARLDKLTWNMDTRTVDLTITSVKKQDVTLIARYGIEEISTSSGVLAAKPQSDKATCDLHLPEGKPVKIHLKIGQRNPLDWVNWV